MTLLANVQSMITNGAAIPEMETPKAKRTRVKAIETTAPLVAVETKPMTLDEACEIAFEVGQGLAGFLSMQSKLSLALLTFNGNETALTAIRLSMVQGYMVRDLEYTREKAKVRSTKLKHNPDNPKLWDDDHRTLEEERCVTSVNVLIYRARKLTGTEKQDTPEAKQERQANTDKAKATKDAKDAAYAIVNPPADVDVFEALRKLVSTMRSLENKYSAKLVGDAGTAWRDWLANAPKA